MAKATDLIVQCPKCKDKGQVVVNRWGGQPTYYCKNCSESYKCGLADSAFEIGYNLAKKQLQEDLRELLGIPDFVNKEMHDFHDRMSE